MGDGSHLRSVLAGYDPERLRAGKVLVAGLGAAGQNVVQNLALTGVGHLLLVDHGSFGRGDENCSPLYPTAAEAARIGLGKAAVVAHRTVASGTAGQPLVRYSGSLIQELGDGALAWADLVIATVDDPGTRGWLTQRCRMLGTPLIDGELSGPHFGFAAYSGTAGSPCYLCWRPDQDSPAVIAAGALAAEAAAFVPALQTTAAVLAGYIAELAAQLLHDATGHLDFRTDGNVRLHTLRTRQLPPDPGCRGRHAPEPLLRTLAGVREDDSVAGLIAAIAAQAGHGTITLTEPVELDGPADTKFSELDTRAELPAELAATQLRALGLRAGATLHVALDGGQHGLLRIPGDVLDCTELAVRPPAPPLLKPGRSLARWVLP